MAITWKRNARNVKISTDVYIYKVPGMDGKTNFSSGAKKKIFWALIQSLHYTVGTMTE